MYKPKVLVIVGPTASGKTALSIEIAKKIAGEIVSADSMQIYNDMTIGTAKPTKKEQQGIPHYLIDCVLPNEKYSVAQYKKQAEKCITEILGKGKFPIVVGGTGLYINSLIYGIEYQNIETDLKYRKYLEEQAQKQGLDLLYKKAYQIDPEAMKKISSRDKKRILRVLEIYHSTGKTKTQQEKESIKNGVQFQYKVFGLKMEREMLYNRINDRVDRMIQNGLIQEVEQLLEKYNSFPTAMQGLGYKEVVDYLKGNQTKDEMIEKIKKETRHYAKRQLTWFRKNKEITWLDVLDGIEYNQKKILEGIG